MRTRTTTGTMTTSDRAAPADDRVVVYSLRRHAAPAPRGCTPVRVDRHGPLGLGNPYRVSREADRAEALRRYRRLLRADLARDGARSRAISALAARVRAGERLALDCWCAPLPCHADALRAAILARAGAP